MRRLALWAAVAALGAAQGLAGAAEAKIKTPWLGGAAAPAISGVGTVGQVLSVPAYTGASYQWLRNGVAISGATARTYTLVSADGGTTVSVRVSVAGVSVTSGGVTVGQLDFSNASQSGLLLYFP